MMKRCLLLLMLILSLALPAALAENAAPYSPGSVTEDLFAQAFNRGDMVLLSAQYGLTFNETASALLEEEPAVLDALSKALENASFSVGAGKIDNGIRLLLAGRYDAESESAALDVTLDVTRDGIAIMSSVIPEDRLTAKWETLLALCDVSEEEIASILSLRDTDLKAAHAEFIAQLEPLVDMVLQIAAPYGETIMAHIAAMPMEVRENVPAEYGYPAADAEIHTQLTPKMIGDLVIALCDQVSQDATLCAIFDALLAETATADVPAPTTAQVCQTIRESAAQELTDETHPLDIFIGMDDAGVPLYLNIIEQSADGTFSTISYIAGQIEDSDAKLISLDVLALNSAQEITDGLSFVVAYDADETDRHVLAAETALSFYAESQELAALSFSISSAANGTGGYDGACALNMTILDGDDPLSFTMNVSTDMAATEHGGEQLLVSGAMDVTAEGTQIPLTFGGSMITSDTEDGPISIMQESAQLPALGFEEYFESYTLYTADPDSMMTAATETALETASSEALEALASRAMTALEETLTKLVSLLPAELVESIEEEL